MTTTDSKGPVSPSCHQVSRVDGVTKTGIKSRILEEKQGCHHCHPLSSIKSLENSENRGKLGEPKKCANIINNREKRGDSGDSNPIAQINRVGIQEYSPSPEATPDPRYRSSRFRAAVRTCLESLGWPVTFGEVRRLEAQLPEGSRIDWFAWAARIRVGVPIPADRACVETPGGQFVSLEEWTRIYQRLTDWANEVSHG